ncbi:MAG: DNA gyrase inhibitor YacG [Acidobacteria bacterium]|nr:MAG: DNA gyrase inhibitor YacG [Acidobacteriota bacterium]
MKRRKPRCPTCGQKISSDSPFIPFCSPRCRLLDLGKWLDGDYSIPGPRVSDTETETEVEE